MHGSKKNKIMCTSVITDNVNVYNYYTYIDGVWIIFMIDGNIPGNGLFLSALSWY